MPGMGAFNKDAIVGFGNKRAKFVGKLIKGSTISACFSRGDGVFGGRTDSKKMFYVVFFNLPADVLVGGFLILAQLIHLAENKNRSEAVLATIGNESV